MEKIAAALLLLSLWAPLRGEEKSPADLFREANASYQKGDYAAAKESYEKLSSEGWAGSALNYNLGNACFRLGQFARARLWYERALEEAPRDEDLRHNRDVARARLGITDEEDPGVLAAWVGPLSIFFAALNFLFFGLLCWGLFHRHEGLWWGRAAAGVLLLGAGAALLAAKTEARRDWGVAMARIEARAGPGENQAAAFILPEGRRVELLGGEGDWVEIGVPAQGLKGWALKSTVEAVRRS